MIYRPGVVGPQQTSHTTIGALSPVGVERRLAPTSRLKISRGRKNLKLQMWQVCADLQTMVGAGGAACDLQPGARTDINSAGRRGPGRGRLGSCPLFHSQDRWRDTCSCLNITFPVLCSSSRHPRVPPRAFSVRGPPPRKRASLGGNNCFAGMPTFGAVLSVRVRADEGWE